MRLEAIKNGEMSDIMKNHKKLLCGVCIVLAMTTFYIGIVTYKFKRNWMKKY
ncbi:MAG: hypothetical protein IKP88_11960 [Lachnospiraceae bacterium]|nr:hypothetical protein [Lachnospiraceae bacterium]